VQVARLAGLPAPVIARAKALLAELEEADSSEPTRATPSSSVFSRSRTRPADAELASLDLAHLTPLER
jgi:DNA mismatch repair protein MutS